MVVGGDVAHYGAGAQAQAGLPALLAEHARPDTVWWFGDVDRDGLRFAAGAASALEVEGLDVLPHRPLYRALIARGIVADSQVAPMDATDAAQLAAWLDDGELERFAVAALRSGRRAMQEQVGPRELGRLEAAHGRAVRPGIVETLDPFKVSVVTAVPWVAVAVRSSVASDSTWTTSGPCECRRENPSTRKANI